ncbi:major facilitator superfamily domain-containing protein [Penicillium odoratum]|uniref:major facilitator superfamily domain-containing protein n=1 Tax=Penicillium odoratum TaxID=1167516 RepID=UPI002548E4DE|nr:major facilitator superfamily domain-containing protein [Penicillium odoratum]KAJ5758666.1 major facilitator superfamily domain-containing protein [Penicillium odoratum]
MGTELIDEDNAGTQPELEMQYLHGWRLYTMAVRIHRFVDKGVRDLGMEKYIPDSNGDFSCILLGVRTIKNRDSTDNMPCFPRIGWWRHVFIGHALCLSAGSQGQICDIQWLDINNHRISNDYRSRHWGCTWPKLSLEMVILSEVSSAIVLIIMSAAFWAAFFAWEILISSKEPHIKPVFPKRFFSNWPLIGIFLTSFIVGIPYNSIIVYLPQRFQALLGDSALMAGIRLLGYSGVTAFSSTIAIVISTRLGIPFLPILLTGAVLNLVGIVLLSTLPTSNVFPAAGYGYEVIAGCGMGIAYGISIFSVPYLLSPKDLQEGSGVVVQMRYLGSSLGVSISSNIFNGRLKSGVSQLIPKDAYEKLLHNVESLSSLPPNIRSRVQDNFSESYRIQFQVLIGFAVAQLAVAFLLIRKGKQIRPSELATH